MQHAKFIIILSLMFLLSACLNSPSWKGVKEEIPPRTFKRISLNFYSNNPGSLEKIENDLLYRCAQVTLREGYDSFVIVGGDVPLFDFYTTPHQANHYLNLNFSGYGSYPVYDLHPVQKCFCKGRFKSTVIINMFKDEKPSGLLNAYNARELIMGSGQTPSPYCYLDKRAT